MKKVYTMLAAVLLAGLLLVGLTSLFRLDDETQKPSLTLSGLWDGSYAAKSRSYYAEAFPQSDRLKAANTTLNSFYRFSGLSGDVQLLVRMDSTAADGGAALATQPSEQVPEASSDEPLSSTEPSAESTQPSSQPQQEAVVEDLGAAMLIGNRAVEVPYASKAAMSKYSQAVTAIADALGSSVRTFSIAVPNSAEFYTSSDYHSGDNSQIDMIRYCYDNMGANVVTVDAYSKLAAHTEEYIYFRTDHHWTQLGAYYAYTAYCEAAGLTAEPLSRFETGKYENFLGSMYNYLASYPQSEVLKNDPDVVYFYRPFVDLNTNYYEDATMNNPIPTGTLCKVEDSVMNKYLCFLGGDHPITTIETSADGPVCLLLKESYGNCFAPWLTSHYSKVIVVDPREFNRDGKPSMDLVAFAKEQNVSDCIILNYPMMLNSDYYSDWLARLVE